MKERKKLARIVKTINVKRDYVSQMRAKCQRDNLNKHMWPLIFWA